MTLQTQHTANAPATLTDEQRRRVADALKGAQSDRKTQCHDLNASSSVANCHVSLNHSCRACCMWRTARVGPRHLVG